MSQALPGQNMDVHSWRQEGKGFGTHCLSAGIAAWQVLLQPAGEAVWCAESCRVQGWRSGHSLLGGIDWIGFVALHKP